MTLYFHFSALTLKKTPGETWSAWKKEWACADLAIKTLWLPRQEVTSFSAPSQIRLTYGGLTSGLLLQLSTLFLSNLMPQLFHLFYTKRNSLKSPRNKLLADAFLPTGKSSLKNLLAIIAKYIWSMRLWNFVLTERPPISYGWKWANIHLDQTLTKIQGSAFFHEV